MRDFGIAGELTGALLSAAGIFLPGTFLIFFVIRFWDSLKTFRPVRASLEGITAASTGLVVGAAVMLFQPLPNNFTSWGLAVGTFALLAFTRIPHPLIILGGLVLGLALK
jgi:chromate transporter